MKKVLVFGITETYGGVESVIMNYYRNMDKSKVQFDFVVRTDNPAYKQEILSLGGNIFVTPRLSNGYFRFKKSVCDIFKKTKYDAVWVNDCFLMHLFYLKFAKKYGVPIRIMHSHNSSNMGSFKSKILHKLNKPFLHKYATHFWSCDMCASKWMFTDKIIKSDKHRIINNAIDTDKYAFNNNARQSLRKSLGVHDDEILYGHVGRFHFQKNHEFLIDVFDEIAKKQPKAKLVLIGQGPDKERIKSKVNNLGLTDKVMFLGTRQDTNKLYSAMDVFLFPSLFEGFGLVVLEAECNGLVTFVSDGIPPTAVVGNNTHVIALKESANYWASTIIQLYKDTNYKHGDNLQTIISSGFDIKHEAKKMENFFIQGK